MPHAQRKLDMVRQKSHPSAATAYLLPATPRHSSGCADPPPPFLQPCAMSNNARAEVSLLNSTQTTSVHAMNMAMESKAQFEAEAGFDCQLDDSLLAAISRHGSVGEHRTTGHAQDRTGPGGSPGSLRASTRRGNGNYNNNTVETSFETTVDEQSADGQGKKSRAGESAQVAHRPHGRPPSALPGHRKSSTSGLAPSSKPHLPIHERMTASTLYRQCTPSRRHLASSSQKL